MLCCSYIDKLQYVCAKALHIQKNKKTKNKSALGKTFPLITSIVVNVDCPTHNMDKHGS